MLSQHCCMAYTFGRAPVGCSQCMSSFSVCCQHVVELQQQWPVQQSASACTPSLHSCVKCPRSFLNTQMCRLLTKKIPSPGQLRQGLPSVQAPMHMHVHAHGVRHLACKCKRYRTACQLFIPLGAVLAWWAHLKFSHCDWMSRCFLQRC